MDINDLRDGWEKNNQRGDSPDEATVKFCIGYCMTETADSGGVYKFCKEKGIAWDDKDPWFWIDLAAVIRVGKAYPNSSSSNYHNTVITMPHDVMMARWERWLDWYDTQCKLEFIYTL